MPHKSALQVKPFPQGPSQVEAARTVAALPNVPESHGRAHADASAGVGL